MSWPAGKINQGMWVQNEDGDNISACRQYIERGITVLSNIRRVKTTLDNSYNKQTSP